jgi:hypothetical protein
VPARRGPSAEGELSQRSRAARLPAEGGCWRPHRTSRAGVDGPGAHTLGRNCALTGPVIGLRRSGRTGALSGLSCSRGDSASSLQIRWSWHAAWHTHGVPASHSGVTPHGQECPICMEGSTDGLTAVFSPMQEPRSRRSRTGGHLVFVHCRSLRPGLADARFAWIAAIRALLRTGGFSAPPPARHRGASPSCSRKVGRFGYAAPSGRPRQSRDRRLWAPDPGGQARAVISPDSYLLRVPMRARVVSFGAPRAPCFCSRVSRPRWTRVADA